MNVLIISSAVATADMLVILHADTFPAEEYLFLMNGYVLQ